VPEFHAFYAFRALVKFVTYGKMEPQKAQVPSPALIKAFIINGLRTGFSPV